MSRFTNFAKKTTNVLRPVVSLTASVGTATVIRSVLATVPAANPVAAGVNLIGAVAMSGLASSRVVDYVDAQFDSIDETIDVLDKEIEKKKAAKSTDNSSDI